MYTDDTNSALALATSLVRQQGLDPESVGKSYADWWLAEPERGYPDSAKLVLLGVKEGVSVGIIGRVAFPTGSYANGGAMRIAPLGVAFRNSSVEELRAAVKLAILSSHVHEEAIDGAVVLARAVALLMNCKIPAGCENLTDASADTFSVTWFLEELKAAAQTPALRSRLATMQRYWGTDSWSKVVWSFDADTEAAADEFIATCESDYCTRWFQIRACVAVPCAIWAFLSHWASPEETIVAAVDLGGDADTIGSLAGAMAGALHGCGHYQEETGGGDTAFAFSSASSALSSSSSVSSSVSSTSSSSSASFSASSSDTGRCASTLEGSWFPQRWWDNIENGPRGRDYACRLARELAKLDLHSPMGTDFVTRWTAEEISDGSGMSNEDAHDAAKKAVFAALYAAVPNQGPGEYWPMKLDQYRQANCTPEAQALDV
jgi:poly(ADP-ribose) glycohydrolase ARH3